MHQYSTIEPLQGNAKEAALDPATQTQTQTQTPKDQTLLQPRSWPFRMVKSTRDWLATCWGGSSSSGGPKPTKHGRVKLTEGGDNEPLLDDEKMRHVEGKSKFVPLSFASSRNGAKWSVWRRAGSRGKRAGKGETVTTVVTYA